MFLNTELYSAAVCLNSVAVRSHSSAARYEAGKHTKSEQPDQPKPLTAVNCYSLHFCHNVMLIWPASNRLRTCTQIHDGPHLAVSTALSAERSARESFASFTYSVTFKKHISRWVTSRLGRWIELVNQDIEVVLCFKGRSVLFCFSV